MDRKSFSRMECPIARAVDQLGDGWSLLILRSAFLGARCFQDFEEQLSIPPSTLTRKLKLLGRRGLLRKVRYHRRPPRSEYVLTDKGSDLLPVLLCLAAWGSRWLSPQGPALVPVRGAHGPSIEPVLCDGRTGAPVRAGEVCLAAGPGASRALRSRLPTPIPFGSPEAP